MSEVSQTIELLGISKREPSPFTHYRNGFRTRAVLATEPNIAHRFQSSYQRVVVKWYRGVQGARECRHYHKTDFHALKALVCNNHIQKSLTAGIMDDVGPYAVVQHIEGEELRERLDCGDLTKGEVSRILRDILENIWIPLWAAGLRFKDCHPGNFILTQGTCVVMIDTEQMRKGANELISCPDTWEQRDKHQERGLGRLPGLVQRIIKSTEPNQRDASILRQVKASLEKTNLPDALRSLGREEAPEEAEEKTVRTLNSFLFDLKSRELIE